VVVVAEDVVIIVVYSKLAEGRQERNNSEPNSVSRAKSVIIPNRFGIARLERDNSYPI
jgi:hypothetical protein